MHGTMRKQQRARLKFDFPLLLAECLRHNCGLSHLAAWNYVDTLAVLKRVDGVKVADGCAKLQCLRAACGNTGTGCSHRALDDAIVLGDVVGLRQWVSRQKLYSDHSRSRWMCLALLSR